MVYFYPNFFAILLSSSEVTIHYYFTMYRLNLNIELCFVFAHYLVKTIEVKTEDHTWKMKWFVHTPLIKKSYVLLPYSQYAYDDT